MIGYVYVLLSPNCDGCYVGSTTQPPLSRLKSHRQRSKDDKRPLSSKQILQAGDAHICVLEHIDKEQDLETREQHWMDVLPNVVNANSSIIGKDTIWCECGGRYIKKNKGHHIRSKRHINWVANKQPKEIEIKNEKTYCVKCPCGGSYDSCHRSRHFQTHLHRGYIASLEGKV